MTYEATVNVTREDGLWLGEVPNLPGAHAYARTLYKLRAEMVDVIILSADLDDDTEVLIDFHLDARDLLDSAGNKGADYVERALKVARRRHELERDVADLQQTSVGLAQELAKAGWSVRDIAGALDLSPGRISQLV